MTDIIKIGPKICLETESLFGKNIGGPYVKVHKSLYYLNVYDIDKIKSITKYKHIIITENDYKNIDIIVKFAKITKIPVELYLSNGFDKIKINIIIQKFIKHKIVYSHMPVIKRSLVP
jgi:hypothetical protein